MMRESTALVQPGRRLPVLMGRLRRARYADMLELPGAEWPFLCMTVWMRTSTTTWADTRYDMR